jgi:hypothetical protein
MTILMPATSPRSGGKGNGSDPAFSDRPARADGWRSGSHSGDGDGGDGGRK